MGKQSKRKKDKAVWRNFRSGKEMVAVIPHPGGAIAVQYSVPPDPEINEEIACIFSYAYSVREIAKNKQVQFGKGILMLSDADYRRNILGLEDNPLDGSIVYNWLTVSDLKLSKPNMDKGWDMILTKLIAMSVQETNFDFGFPLWWRGVPLFVENKENGNAFVSVLMDVVMVVRYDFKHSGLNVQPIPRAQQKSVPIPIY